MNSSHLLFTMIFAHFCSLRHSFLSYSLFYFSIFYILKFILFYIHVPLFASSLLFFFQFFFMLLFVFPGSVTIPHNLKKPCGESGKISIDRLETFWRIFHCITRSWCTSKFVWQCSTLSLFLNSFGLNSILLFSN